MGKFGWSYPPGCSGTPFDEDYPCEVCGREVGQCVCPECPVCGEQGNPDCYEQHGMIRTDAQVESLRAAEAEWERACSEEADGLADFFSDAEELERK